MNLSTPARLKADIRLAQAVSHFEADLTSEQKADFRNQRSITRDRPPELSDVMHLTALIDRKASSQRGLQTRCVGPRLTNFLQSIQQYVALGDVVVGGSQNLVACGVWALVRSSLLLVVNHASYLEKLSILFMHAGRAAPRYQQMALLYPRSRVLQANLAEYFIVVVEICHHVLKFSRKSYFGQLSATIGDVDLKQYQIDLDTWASAIKEEVILLMGRTIEDEAKENSGFRAMMSSFSDSTTHRRTTKDRLTVLDACSKFDYQTPWKQARKMGNTTLFMESPTYKWWKSDTTGGSHTLICTGKLGSGKSVMMANMVDDLNIDAQVDKAPVAHFFCRHDIPESLQPRTIIGSLIRQLLTAVPELLPLPTMWDLSYSIDVDDLTRYLFSASLPWSHCYLIVDGADECAAPDLEVLLSCLRTLQQGIHLMLCLSLRLEADQRLHVNFGHLLSPMVLTIPEDNPEIAAFIDSEIEARLKQGFTIGDPKIIPEIQQALLRGAQGMFLWVSLQISALSSEKTDEKIRLALQNLPATLSETFSRVLQKASSNDKEYQRSILELVAVASRPLTAQELREALSVTPCDTTWNPAKIINDIHSLLTCCGSLIMADEEEGTIRLVHHSVRQYLFGDFGDDTGFSFEDANRRMGRIILTYLNYNIFDTQLSKAVVPNINSEAAPRRIINVIDTKSSRNVALKLLKSKAKATSPMLSNYHLGQSLASRSAYFKTMPVSFAFHDYAKACWLVHTTSIPKTDTFAHRALIRLFDRQDSFDLILIPWGQGLSSMHESSLMTWSTLRHSFSFSTMYLSMRISHPPLFRHQKGTKVSFKTAACIFICLRALATLAEPPPWDEEMSAELLPFAIVSRSISAVRFLLQRSFIDKRHNELVLGAILQEDEELLDAIFSHMNPSEIKTFVNSMEISPDHRTTLEGNTSLVPYLVSLGADVNLPTLFPSSLFHVLDSISTLGAERFVEAAFALINIGVDLTFSFHSRTAYKLLANCLRAETRLGDRGLLQCVGALFSKDQLDHILFECCSLDRYGHPELILFVLKMGASPDYFNNEAHMSSISRLIRSKHQHLVLLDTALRKARASPSPLVGFTDSDFHLFLRKFKKSDDLQRFISSCPDRGHTHQISNLHTPVPDYITKLYYNEVKFLCSQIGVGINGQLLHPHSPPTPLLIYIVRGSPEFDPFDMVMQILLRAANMSSTPLLTHRLPVGAVLDRALKSGLPCTEGLAFLLLTRAFVVFGGDFDASLVGRVLYHFLSLVESYLIGDYEELFGEEVAYGGDKYELLSTLTSKLCLREECASQLKELLRAMLLRKPLSSSVRESHMWAIKGRIFRKGSLRGIDTQASHTFVEQVVDILSMLIPSKHDPNLYKDVKLLEDRASDIIVDCLFYGHLNSQPQWRDATDRAKHLNERGNRAANPYFPLYPVLKLGRRFHKGIAECCSHMSCQSWVNFMMSGIRVSVEMGDVESTRAGCELIMSKEGAPDVLIQIKEAERIRALANACAQDGTVYELEATPVFHKPRYAT